MWQVLWFTLAAPSTIQTTGEFAAFALAIFAVALITWTFMAVVGRRIMRHSWMIAFFSGIAFVPALIAGTAILTIPNTPAGSPPDEIPGALFMSLFILLGGSIPVSLAATAIYVSRYRRRYIR